MYDTEEPGEQAFAFYDSSMAARGWARQPLTNDGETALSPYVHVYRNASTVLLAVVTATPQAKTGISLVEIGAPGKVFATSAPRDQTESGDAR
jgi:hypothetical protein